jgi:hypothetical protein
VYIVLHRLPKREVIRSKLNFLKELMRESFSCYGQHLKITDFHFFSKKGQEAPGNLASVTAQ